MKNRAYFIMPVFAATLTLAACGTYTPDKHPFVSDEPTEANPLTTEGEYETGIVNHIACEIGLGLLEVKDLNLPWLIERWGTTVTQTVTVEDQTGVSPGVSAITPLRNVVFPFSTGGNVVSPQSFSASFGVTASANALRTETIQYTFRNKDILRYFKPSCVRKIKGAMIDGDLKIRQFIYDKAQIASSKNFPGAQGAPFNTWTEEITFVAAYGGTFTPTWKLARITANTSSNLLVGERTNTNDLIITLGPLKYDHLPLDGPIVLADSAMTQHQARVQAAAIAVSITGQSH
jgi:hypothetical protein